MFKAAVLGPTLFPLRLVVLVGAMTVQLLIARVVIIGYPLLEDRGCLYHKEPLPRWRRMLLAPVFVTNRIILWSFGFWRISIVDRRKDKSKRPNIVTVAPHQTIIDPFVMAYAFPALPAAVGKSDLLDMPLVYSLYVAGQGIFVDRRNAESRHACKEAIAMRADPKRWSGAPTVIYPEGTTTNGRMLVQFKLGPFCPGQPVLPVLLRYPTKHYNMSWVGRNGSLPMLILRLMLQFSNSCEVEILDAYEPSEAERADAKLFARNVRASMATRLGVSTTEHTYDDVFLAVEATRFKVGSDFEVGDVTKKYQVSFDELSTWLKRFHKLDSNGDGFLSQSEFASVVTAGGASFSEESVANLFAFFDTDQDGTIQYREFVQVLALLSGRCSSESCAKLAFLVYDDDGRGVVRRDVLRRALDASVAVDHATPAAAAGAAGPSPGEQLLGPGGGDEVSFEEFEKVVHAHPEVLEHAFKLVRERLGLHEMQEGGKRRRGGDAD